MKRIPAIALLFSTFSLSAQTDTTVQNVAEVKVLVNSIDTIRIPPRYGFYLGKKQIEDLSLNDLGELMQKFPGISLRSYGGLGGMKTFSYRSLGSQHVAIVVDGFTMKNAQTGQVNLGQLSVSNMNSVYNTSELDNLLLPVSAQLSGASFSASTFDNSIGTTKGLSLRAGSTFASFGQCGGDLSAKCTGNKYFINTNGSFRRSDGNYPFSYMNGSQRVNAVRNNNDYREYNFGNTIGIRLKRGQVRAGYLYKDIEQGLPGAVVYYNATADERLYTKWLHTFADFDKWIGSVRLRLYTQWDRYNLRYMDTSYLNNAGMLDNRFLNDCQATGANLFWKKEHFILFGGMEEEISHLQASDSLMDEPLRWRNMQLLGVEWSNRNWRFKAFGSGQYIIETIDGKRDRDLYRVNPVLSVRHESYKKMRSSHMLTYRNSFRLPSFNELYYNNIGNKDLKPEDANQLSYEFASAPFYRKKFRLDIMGHAFANRVDNLILAIPTKNLFVWSMQNIGKTYAYGGDLLIKFAKRIRKIDLSTDVNYTFQRTLDMTDRESPTYQDQVAYIPIHTANGDLTASYKSTGIRFSGLYVGSRYSLNENIETNRIDPFQVADLSIFHTLKMKKEQSVRFQFNVKNIFNTSYAYVRSYAMPGRSYLLTISYALH